MAQVLALDALLAERRLWKGTATPAGHSAPSTGHAALDALLPGGGWPQAALSEVLVDAPGRGELQLLWPTLVRLSRASEPVVLVAPPDIPYAPAWQAAGMDLRGLHWVQAQDQEALWAVEQCLRAGCCGAVLCWPQPRLLHDRALRRLQMAAEQGRSLAFVWRPPGMAAQPSPAALRLLLQARPARLRILKCRGGTAPETELPWPGGVLDPPAPTRATLHVLRPRGARHAS